MLRLETPENLVQFMKERNIKFEKITEQDAIKFLNHNTYYKKVSSYKRFFPTLVEIIDDFYSYMCYTERKIFLLGRRYIWMNLLNF